MNQLLEINHCAGIYVQVNKRQQKTGLHRYSKHPGSCSQASQEDGEEVKAEPGHAHCPLCLPEEHFDPGYDKQAAYGMRCMYTDVLLI